MTKNPYINALAALLYISFVASVMYYGGRYAPRVNNFFGPIVFISLFTLSAAVMGYVFCLQPIELYLDGSKKKGIDLFVKTIAVFGSITVLLLLVLFSGLIK